jgi:hypothetical protein
MLSMYGKRCWEQKHMESFKFGLFQKLRVVKETLQVELGEDIS